MEASKSAKIEVLDADDKCVLVLEGAVDIFFAGDLRAAALDAVRRGRDVAVACDKLERLDTATLQILLALKKELAQSSHSLDLSSLAGTPGDLAALAGLAGHLL
jgi:anti-anti-sigma regulatory factor